MSEGQINAARKAGYQYMLAQFAQFPSSSVLDSFTISAGKSSVKCSIESEFGGANQALKLQAIKEGVRLVLEKGFALPDLYFRLGSSMGVANAAFSSDAAGNRKAIIVLSGKSWGTAQSYAGKGTMGGVANLQYDSATRWFGDPKQKAFGRSMVVHEIGHILHEINAPEFYWSNKNTGSPECTLRTGQWLNAAMEISGYATQSSIEFVAECFAGTICGVRYSKKVKDAYALCEGPFPAGGKFF
jgi:hypothetical protein